MPMNIDINSADWKAVKEHCESRIISMRQENDENLDEIETARLRGNIEFAKELLDLGIEKFIPEVKSEGYLD